jgi:predicted SAM-dependent methyltransferase
MQNPFKLYSGWRFGKKISDMSSKQEPIRLNIGAGGTAYQGWISAEICDLDITKPHLFSGILGKAKISNILAEHVVEHIHRTDFESFLFEIRKFMNPGAVIRIAVPDAMHPSEYVRELTKPGGLEPGAEDHKEFYSLEMMRNIAETTELQINPLEWFDDSGAFNYKYDDWSNGFISRSRENYRGRFSNDPMEYKKMWDSIPCHLRNQFGELNMSYTSLIIDFKIP